MLCPKINCPGMDGEKLEITIMTNRFCVNCEHLIPKPLLNSRFLHYPRCDLFLYKEEVDPVTGERVFASDYSSSCELNRMKEGRCRGELFTQMTTPPRKSFISKFLDWIDEVF